MNPSDVDSPILLRIGDVRINVESPFPASTPTKRERQRFIARHPVTSARYFDRTMQTFFPLLVASDPTGPTKSVFGRVHAHYSTIECRERGSLHAQFMLWLHQQPTDPGSHHQSFGVASVHALCRQHRFS